jgi:hypothetical protein
MQPFPLPSLESVHPWTTTVAVVGVGPLGEVVARGLPDAADAELTIVMCDHRDPDALIEAADVAQRARLTGRLTLGFVAVPAAELPRWADLRDTLRTAFRESVDTLFLVADETDDAVDAIREPIVRCLRTLIQTGQVNIDLQDTAYLFGGPGNIGLVCSGDVDSPAAARLLIERAAVQHESLRGVTPSVLQLVEHDPSARFGDWAELFVEIPPYVTSDTAMVGDVTTPGLGQRRRMSIFTSYELPSAPAH